MTARRGLSRKCRASTAPGSTLGAGEVLEGQSHGASSRRALSFSREAALRTLKAPPRAMWPCAPSSSPRGFPCSPSFSLRALLRCSMPPTLTVASANVSCLRGQCGSHGMRHSADCIVPHVLPQRWTPRSLTLCSGSSRFLPRFRTIAARCATTLGSSAYLHWFERFGMDSAELHEALEALERRCDSAEQHFAL